MSIAERKLKETSRLSHEQKGLSEKEARQKLQKHGLNTITRKKKISALKILFQQFSDFMVLILLACTAVSVFMGEITESVTIIAIVIVNAALGFVQEYKTERTLEALKGLAAPTARVIRDGHLSEVQAEQLVPGDLILLEAGDRIPADAVLVECISLQIDESLLTGESIPVEKVIHAGSRKQFDTSDKLGAAFMGTIVTSGRGRAIVYATGMSTEMGQIADLIQNIDEEETPLQKRLDHLGKFIVFCCLAICAVVSVTGILRGEPIFTMLLAGISLAVAAVPEGLPAIVTIALALGVQRMLKRNALIRKLPAVETLGCASVICSDKTGTLTENRMTVRKIYAAGDMCDVSGTGYSTEGIFRINGKKIDPRKPAAIRLALEIGALCNNAEITSQESGMSGAFGKLKDAIAGEERNTVKGDPTEGALLIAAAKAGLNGEALGKLYFRIDEIPFDSDRKCMSVVCDNHMGESYVFTKGAPDMIIDKCSRIATASGTIPLSPVLKRGILNVNDSMAGEALRVLGLAYRKLESRNYKNWELEKDLIFVGLAGMIDPPRQEALEAVQECKLAGIKPVMITGDHKVTAAAIARELTILSDGDRVMTGNDLELLSDSQLEKAVENTSVYARVSPKHKLMIVKALKKRGRIVAMTGDGVNDAPAVKEADIGVSMGITGTDVTKEASSMILLDDNFATIVAAIEEGRVIYDNIRKFIRYMLACNLGEVLTMFLGMLLALPLPLLPIQVLWVNLVTDGLPAIALGLDPPDRDVMMRPSRGANESVFSNGLAHTIVLRGVIIGFSTLAVFISIMHFTGNVQTARTGAFMTLVMTQLIHVFECKSETRSLLDINLLNNPMLIGAVMISLIMILGVIYIPILQGVFKTVPLGLNEWLLVAGFSFLGPIGAGLFKPKRR